MNLNLLNEYDWDAALDRVRQVEQSPYVAIASKVEPKAKSYPTTPEEEALAIARATIWRSDWTL